MAIQCVDRRYVVTIKGFGRGRVVPLIGIAATREEARTLEAEMIAAKRSGLPWTSSQPAKGTLAAALDEAWGRSDGWHSKRCGPAHYSTAFDFITEAGADSQASGMTEKMVATFLAKRPDAAAAVFQLLEVVAEGLVWAGGVTPSHYTATVFPGPKKNIVFNASTIFWAQGLGDPPGQRRAAQPEPQLHPV